MKVNGKLMRSIWVEADGAVGVIDQTVLPHDFRTVRLTSRDDAAHAISSMLVRGAPLIGAVLLIPALAYLIDRAWMQRETLRWPIAAVVVFALALIWPSHPSVTGRFEWIYEPVFVPLAYGYLGLVLAALAAVAEDERGDVANQGAEHGEEKQHHDQRRLEAREEDFEADLL